MEVDKEGKKGSFEGKMVEKEPNEGFDCNHTGGGSIANVSCLLYLYL